MQPLLISDDPNWLLKVIEKLSRDELFQRISTETGLPLLPIPDPAGLVSIGYANYDAPNTGLLEQTVAFPWVVFTVRYPFHEFSSSAITKPNHNQSIEASYASIFGEAQQFTTYYARVHRENKYLNDYYRLISEVLAHHWLTDQFPSSPEQIQVTARTIVKYLRGAPIHLRDFYILQGKPFLNWLLQHL